MFLHPSCVRCRPSAQCRAGRLPFILYIFPRRLGLCFHFWWTQPPGSCCKKFVPTYLCLKTNCFGLRRSFFPWMSSRRCLFRTRPADVPVSGPSSRDGVLFLLCALFSFFTDFLALFFFWDFSFDLCPICNWVGFSSRLCHPLFEALSYFASWNGHRFPSCALRCIGYRPDHKALVGRLTISTSP